MMTQTAADRSSAMRASIEKTMQRVEKLVDSETAALRSRTPIDLKESNNGKSQALLEFSHAVRALEGVPLDDALVSRLRQLRGKLETNRAVLKRHLEAVREIADVVADTIQHSEGDGTYSQYGSDYGSDDLIGSYATDETGSLDAAGELNDFLLLDGTGDWTLEIYDGGTSDTRTLNVWGVQLDCRQRGVRHRRIQGVPRGQRPD